LGQRGHMELRWWGSGMGWRRKGGRGWTEVSTVS